MTNFILVIVLFVMIGGSICYIVSQKKKGVACVGCSCAGSCQKSQQACGCNCQNSASETSCKKME